MEPVLAPTLRSEGLETATRTAPRRKAGRRTRIVRLALALLLLLVLVMAVLYEMRTSNLQSLLLSMWSRDISWKIEPGPGTTLRAPDAGPYDSRLGYTRLPAFLERLQGAGYSVDRQARPSSRMGRLVEKGVFPIYREKSQAGLSITDSQGEALYESRTPERAFESFHSI